MYIVRWLTGHPLIAIWVLGAIAILLTRNAWFGQHKDVVSESHQTALHADANPNGQKLPEMNHIAAATIPENDSVVEEEIVVVEIVSNETDNAISEKSDSSKQELSEINAEALKNDEVDSNTIQQSLNAVKSDVEKENTLSVAVNSQVNESITEVSNADSENNTPPMGVKNDASVSDLSGSSNEDMLLMAREAYWNNGLDEAAEIYQQLIELEPDVLEHKGELGNVYWRQGFPKKAAELYSEIAIPMIKNGDAERVANMIGFIGLFYPDRAAEINKQLQAQDGNTQQ